MNQTGSVSSVGSGDPGWSITLDASTTTRGAERIVTDPVALTNGTVFFTSFKPTLDLCAFGGDSYFWGVDYATGGAAASNALIGKALIQLSTGEFRPVDLSTTNKDRQSRRIQPPMPGKSSPDAPPIITNSANRPLKRILHIQEH